MDETLTAARRYARGFLGAVLAAAWLHVPAQPLTDPTRPPASLSAPPATDGAVSAAGGPVLQSIIVGPKRREAVISGETVRQGDRVGDARVARITDTEVVLRNGRDVQVLRLFPVLDKRPANAYGVRHGRKDQE